MKQIKRLKSSLENFAAAPWECAYLQDGGQSRLWLWIVNVYFIFVIWHNMSINSLHLCLCLFCRLLHCCKPLSKYAVRPWSANLHLTQPWWQHYVSLWCHCTCPHRDGQAEFIQITGYIAWHLSHVKMQELRKDAHSLKIIFTPLFVTCLHFKLGKTNQ